MLLPWCRCAFPELGYQDPKLFLRIKWIVVID